MWMPRGRLPGCSKKSLKYHARKRGGRKAALFCVAGKERLCLPQGRYILCRFPFAAKDRRFPKGDRKALWSPPQRRNPLRYGTGKEGPSLPQGRYILCRFPYAAKGRRFPKGDRKALWSPPQRRNPLRNSAQQERLFPWGKRGLARCSLSWLHAAPVPRGASPGWCQRARGVKGAGIPPPFLGRAFLFRMP